MSNLDYVIITIASAITILFAIECYSKISRNQLIRINFKILLLILLGGILVTINTYTNVGYSRPFISYIIILIIAWFIFKDELSKTILLFTYCYLIMTFYEIVLSVIIQLRFSDLSVFDKNILLKISFSIVSVGISLLTCYSNKIRKIILKFTNKLSNNKIIIIIFSLVLIILFVIDVKYSSKLNLTVYIGNVIIMISTFLLFCLNIINYFKINKEIEKTETILNFMTKYEKTIDEDRINRHEMLNNLLLLKSIKNKNSKEYNDTLNELVSIYNRKGIGVKNIYKLPSGLKGIFYYKLKGLDENGFNINIKISKDINNSLKKLDHKTYVSLYRIISILLDNAIEASNCTNKKYISIDIYKNNKEIIIIIDNSFKNKISINKINEKNYSTKGKGRGLGLYIMNIILKQSDKISVKHEINNDIFSSIIKIKMS